MIRNGSVRLSRLDVLNDSEENKRLAVKTGMRNTSLWHNKVYALCFTHETINGEYMQENYGSDLRIGFYRGALPTQFYVDTQCQIELLPALTRSEVQHSLYASSEDQRVFDHSVLDIIYTDNIGAYSEGLTLPTLPGGVKSKIGLNNRTGKMQAWWMQHETRLRVA